MDLGGPEWSPVTEGGLRRPGPLWWSWMLLGGPWFEVDLVGLYGFAKWCRWSKVVMDGPLSIMVQCKH